MGRQQAWPAQHPKSAASFNLMKSSVHAQVLELQRKIQLLGKMAADCTEGSGISGAHAVFCVTGASPARV